EPLTLQLCQLAFCESPQAQSPCEQCKSCRHVASGTHADFLRLGEDATNEISIEQARSLIPFLSRAPLSGKRRVVWISNAHMLNVHASNALLKILEEPPPHTLIIVTTHNPEALPATVRSRCQHV